MTNNELVHRLLYWNENNQYVFSRTKFLTLVTFIITFVCSLTTPILIIPVLAGFCVSAPVFIIGWLIHKFMKIDSSFSQDNLSEDIKHFLFYWNYGANEFELSKTKIITVFIIIIGLLWAFQIVIDGEYAGGELTGTLIACILICLFVAIISFFIGFGIHKFKQNNNIKPNSTYNYNKSTNDMNREKLKNIDFTKININNSNKSSNFIEYKSKIDNLKKEFDEKKLTTKGLIKTKFEPPQITYDRFITIVDDCIKIFNEQYTAALNLINFANDDSAKVCEEIDSKINIMQSLIDKLDELSSELVIQMSKTKDDDINNVLNNMEDLISSINSYNE